MLILKSSLLADVLIAAEKSAEAFAVHVACIDYRCVPFFFIFLTASQQDNVLFACMIGISSCYYYIRDVCCAYTKVAIDVTQSMHVH